METRPLRPVAVFQVLQLPQQAVLLQAHHAVRMLAGAP